MHLVHPVRLVCRARQEQQRGDGARRRHGHTTSRRILTRNWLEHTRSLMVVRTSLRRFASQALVDFSAAPPGLRECVRVIPEFVTRDEERALAAELDPIFARQRYRRDHWDGVITGYKETERAAREFTLRCDFRICCPALRRV